MGPTGSSPPAVPGSAARSRAGAQPSLGAAVQRRAERVGPVTRAVPAAPFPLRRFHSAVPARRRAPLRGRRDRATRWYRRSQWQRMPARFRVAIRPAPRRQRGQGSTTRVQSPVRSCTLAGRRGRSRREETIVTRDKAHKTAIRERMAATGEPYSEARRMLLDPAAGPPGAPVPEDPAIPAAGFPETPEERYAREAAAAGMPSAAVAAQGILCAAQDMADRAQERPNRERQAADEARARADAAEEAAERAEEQAELAEEAAGLAEEWGDEAEMDR